MCNYHNRQFSYLLSSSHGIYSKDIFRQQLNCICLNILFFSIVLDKGSRKTVIDKSYGKVVCCLKSSFQTRNLKSQRDGRIPKGKKSLKVLTSFWMALPLLPPCYKLCFCCNYFKLFIYY